MAHDPHERHAHGPSERHRREADHAHADEDHEHAEAFPRIRTAQLVAETLDRDEDSRRRRERWQSVLLGVAVALIALGVPSGILVGRTLSVVVPSSHRAFDGDVLPGYVARALSTATGWTAERSWFAVSAVALGASVAIWHAWALRRAWSHGAVALALLAVVLAPTTWLAGTTPGTASCSILGATLVLLALDGDDDRVMSLSLRASGAWLFASFLSLSNVLSWPAVVWRVGRAAWRRSPSALVPVVLAPLVGFGAWSSVHALARVDGERTHSALRCLTAELLPNLAPSIPEQPLPNEALAWVGWALLGGVLVGIVALSFAVLRIGDSRPRLGTWVVFALAPIVAGPGLYRDIPFAWLVPLGFVGLLEASRRWPFVAWFALAASLGAQVVSWRLDTERPWRSAIEERLDPGDVVFTESRDRAYLLEQRYGLRAVVIGIQPGEVRDTSPAGEDRALRYFESLMDERARTGSRVVLDSPTPDGGWTPEQRAELSKHANVTLPAMDP